MRGQYVRTQDPREDKLPAWVRDTLFQLRKELDEAESARDAARLATNPTKSTAIMDFMEHGKMPIGLDRAYREGGDLHPANVRFRLDMALNLEASERYGSYIDCRAEGKHLLVHGGSALVIEPWISNVVKISCDRRNGHG